MAKPFLVASSGLPGSSKPSNCTPHHRKILVPSSGFLSLLASVVSATTVHGSPAPPPFLCPSIPLEAVVEPVIRKRTAKPTRIPANSNTKRRHHHLPDRYDKDTDGIWRRVGSYTLYGSTMPPSPPSCTGVCPPTNVSIDDQIQAGGQNSTTTTTPSYDIRDSLPPGWNPTAKPYAGRTGLILAMSLVLALFICFFIVACLFWRKRIRKKRKDVEAKARRSRSSNREQAHRELAIEKEKKAKQRVWARATARWIRHRRANRLSSRLPHGHQSSDHSLSLLARPSSLTPSTRSSPQSSTISIPNQLRDEVEIVTDLQDPVLPTITPGPTPTSPPAYQHGLPPIIVSTSSTDDSTGECAGPSGFDCSHRPPCSLSNSSLSPADAETSAPTPLHVAHVATDDKSLLARLAELASSPPPDDSSDLDETPEATQVSAPVWHDEDIEDIDCNQPNDLSTDENTYPVPPMFPPPPSKERLAATEFYNYPFTFHEAESGILESEPSAPPFEEQSSGALEGTLVPSAPPLLDDSGHFIPESAASAPEWDPGVDMQPIERENASGQDHDRIPSEVTTALVSLPSSSNPQLPFTASATLALPGYQP